MNRAAHIAKVIRRRLLLAVHPMLRAPGPVAVALSGGVDSCSVLAAMLAKGINPVVISYTPDTHESTDFRMARATAERFGLEFVPAVVSMKPLDLEFYARTVIQLGYAGKVEVECLSPLVSICQTAAAANVKVMFTGDQADGFFCLSKWASHNADRAAGIPRGRRTNVQGDTNPKRIDYLRERYWRLDKSCSGGVQRIGEENEVRIVVPYRDEKIREAFRGSLWSEVNKPRIKEPIRLAFEEELRSIPTRRLPVNLHKGDSKFAQMMGAILLSQPHLQGPWRSTTGLYRAMARGEV